MVHRRTDPRSPVQSARSNSCLPFVLAILAALAFWGWRNRDHATDWVERQARERTQLPQPRAIERRESPPPTDLPLQQVPQRARANLPALFSSDDYPMEAIRNEEQGTVRFRLTISNRGRVSRCEIVDSSGSAALDRQTCAILTSRARFDPARDGHGQPVTDSLTARIRWELPE